ncbi:MAG: ribosome biogenesis GTPase Der [Ignavibacteriales bacterium]|nr:ribosome biogenesis GTPase Der [Ignavibacteriales bacterium]MCF8305437.1 ribosome biogenesis GTPase Der [Ignavibacteriales bacterium]MCF8316120.1 ribosome biogenesis GTPase Der [Ignavibacteriales bacterium]MCF8436622.1 ribosome biogenesis GTPase Der [Ignavibacteriales bacterium]
MISPLIVIVGRPNVGKSTLFNRLTKSNNAIVDDVSGVTRDRIYGEYDWNGRVFKVMDTGGYVPDSDDKFEAAIREQVEISLTEADVILFVTDARTGITPIDNEVAKLLRRSNKPIYLLVNKVDNTEMTFYKADFYSLGIENVHDISAMSGRNLGDLLDDISSNFTDVPGSGDEDIRLKIAILGKPNVGKSSLTNALLGFERSIVTDIPGTTRDSINSILKYYGEEIVLIDTAGLRRKARVQENIEFFSNVRTYRALWECDVAVILIDATEGLDKQDTRIIYEAVQRRKGIVIGVNKWDLIEKETNTAREFELDIREKLGPAGHAPILFISALTKQRIIKIIETAKLVNEKRKTKISTSELNDALLPVIAQITPPAAATGREIKIKYITQVGDHYPIFLFFANDVKFIPESYRRFLENTIRTKFGFEGVPMTVSFKEK